MVRDLALDMNISRASQLQYTIPDSRLTCKFVAVTAPYMHDGSIATLSEAVDHEIYYRGFSRGHPINLSLAERQALVAFLEPLTDSV
jgi:cytochrome c peroxidase